MGKPANMPGYVYDSKGNYRGKPIKNPATGAYEWAGDLKSGKVNET